MRKTRVSSKSGACILIMPDLYRQIIIESPVNSWTFSQPHWFDNVKVEHIACRQKVSLFDMSSFAKFEIKVAKSDYHNICYYNQESLV